MPMRTPLAVFAATMLFAASPAVASASYQELLARPAPKPDAHVAYGKAAQQAGDLYLPKGDGLRAVVVLIHGGCWLGDLPGPELMAPMVGPLRAKGFAVWNIDYRRLGQTGGGYPGTFLDAGAAVDELRTLAPRYRLDLAHVAVVGRSGPEGTWPPGPPRADASRRQARSMPRTRCRCAAWSASAASSTSKPIARKVPAPAAGRRRSTASSATAPILMPTPRRRRSRRAG